MRQQMTRSRRIAFLTSYLVALATLAIGAIPAWSQDKAGSPERMPKIREVVELPEDFVGKTFTYTIQLSTNQGWMQRGGNDFYIFVQDSEGAKLPNNGISPGSTVNYCRFVLSKDDGRKLIDTLHAAKMYNARIRFTIERERDTISNGWRFLAKVSSVELLQNGGS